MHLPSTTVFGAIVAIAALEAAAYTQPACIDGDPLQKLSIEYGTTGCTDPNAGTCGFLADDGTSLPADLYGICHISWDTSRWLINACRDGYILVQKPNPEDSEEKQDKTRNKAIDLTLAKDDDRTYDVAQCVDFRKGSCGDGHVPCVDSDTKFYQCKVNENNSKVECTQDAKKTRRLFH